MNATSEKPKKRQRHPGVIGSTSLANRQMAYQRHRMPLMEMRAPSLADRYPVRAMRRMPCMMKRTRVSEASVKYERERRKKRPKA